MIQTRPGMILEREKSNSLTSKCGGRSQKEGLKWDSKRKNQKRTSFWDPDLPNY